MNKQYVYMFSEGSAAMRNTLGGKGANLSEMVNLGLPVPQGFVVSTDASLRYYDDNETINDSIKNEIFENMKKLEKVSKKEFGSKDNPLLVAVRSGARASMPGMMDTVLNLGLNDEVVVSLGKMTNNPRFAYDSYRRFIQMFSNVVKNVDSELFELVLDEEREKAGVELDSDLSADQMKGIVDKFKSIYKKETGHDFPQEPSEQLIESVTAVFRSWNNPRAIYYRRMNNIPGSWGTAVNIQEMVFGNMGDTSGSGVAFTREPVNGENVIFGEYLTNAQGEDVVAGVRTPFPIADLEKEMPEIYKEFAEICQQLEKHYKDMQDLEFTIENGKLYILQTRGGKRTASASLKIAIDLVNEGMNDKKTALMQLDPSQLDTLLHPQFDENALKAATPIGTGLPASPGAASGKVVFTAGQAVELQDIGEKSILVRLETSPEDIEGMDVAEGFLTARGGMTSHAAVVARGMGKPCVSGLQELEINEKEGYFVLGGKKYNKHDIVSIDGSTGHVYGENIATTEATIGGEFATIMEWADEVRTLKVRTNADTPAELEQAISYGAEGIGLCRTEHMFFEADRIKIMREMILASNQEARENALSRLLPIQRKDFADLFEILGHLPMTIRLLDPPLHEFLPTDRKDIEELARDMNISVDEVDAKIEQLHEFNPMMGFRGVRLSVRYPEIAEMQTEAVISAALEVQARHSDWKIVPEIMIPLIGEVKELTFVKDKVVATADRLIKESGVDMKYQVGTMLEIPRAALTADKIAKETEFFSFGSNDLTQMTFGFSRDDAGNFLGDYYGNQIYESDPFQRLDIEGVGQLVYMAAKRGKKGNPDLKLGICGEHGGDPSTIEFCQAVGLDYVSCSPFRVPIAKLAAARSAIENKYEGKLDEMFSY